MAGLTPKESAIMGLWDAGDSMQLIARKLCLKTGDVRRIVAYYGTADEARVNRVAMKASSARLVGAIERARAA